MGKIALDLAAVLDARALDPLQQLLELIATTSTTELFRNFFAGR